MQFDLLRHLGLAPNSDLCEIGCGIGRLAYQLSGFLEGSYCGFDISAKAIAWLEENYAPLLPRFSFNLVEARNARYSPKGEMAATDVSFPCETSAYDMVCAFSIFTHMQWPEIEHYFREVKRVLRPGGRGVLTFFAITNEDDEPELSPEKPFIRCAEAPPTWTIDPDLPERGIAFADADIRESLGDAGLELLEYRRGFWRDRPEDRQRGGDAPFHKDVYVVT